jgi:hypothetical protein
VGKVVLQGFRLETGTAAFFMQAASGEQKHEWLEALDKALMTGGVW